MSEWVAFGALFAEPSRNGLTRPKATRGAGTKMVNMGELFASSRLWDAVMDRVPLEGDERSRYLLQSGDLLFARQSLVLTGAGKCSIFLGDTEPVTFESHVIRIRLEPTVA
ncbi:MAG: restriction endonuclease subunit S, partial [Chloroflexi bacterium]|nr:restriction endonuclease subunit S [Chloroflexota bacterium]